VLHDDAPPAGNTKSGVAPLQLMTLAYQLRGRISITTSGFPGDADLPPRQYKSLTKVLYYLEEGLIPLMFHYCM
jgi:hypothetical protein